MSRYSWNYWLGLVLLVEVISYCSSSLVTVHSWHIQIHEDYTVLTSWMARKVVLHHLEGLFSRKCCLTKRLWVQSKAVFKNNLKSFYIKALIIHYEYPLIERDLLFLDDVEFFIKSLGANKAYVHDTWLNIKMFGSRSVINFILIILLFVLFINIFNLSYQVWGTWVRGYPFVHQYQRVWNKVSHLRRVLGNFF